NGSSKCLPCKEDEFIEYPNDFPKCFGCRTCREDQVQLSPCTATRNTQCGCRNGTFCSPDHPCEMCQKCRARCLDGEVERAPCTPHSDRQCGPPAAAASNLWYLWLLPVIILFIGIVCWCYCRQRGLHAGECWLCGSWHGAAARERSEELLRRCYPGGRGAQDNEHNERLSRQQQELLPPGLGLGAPLTEVCERVCPFVPGIMVWCLTVPPPLRLERSFDFFPEEIDLKHWKKYGRALDLRENDMAFASKNGECSPEALVQMLRTWLQKQGMEASINVLLETLYEIDLGGVAERISSRLVQRGLYKYEEV
ncbi:TR10B factor, partial [Crypturellus soui]|nr:TR10B factor [Crypturellus soui]